MKNRSLNSQQDRAAAEVRRATPLKPGSAEARQALRLLLQHRYWRADRGRSGYSCVDRGVNKCAQRWAARCAAAPIR
jgi:hypothetical protein